MAHQGREGFPVGVSVRGSIGREIVERGADTIDHARKVQRIALDPLRHIVIISVLPGAEPEKDQMQMVRPGTADQSIDVRPIELPRLRLDLFPIHGRSRRVDVHGFEGWPNFPQHGRPRA